MSADGTAIVTKGLMGLLLLSGLNAACGRPIPKDDAATTDSVAVFPEPETAEDQTAQVITRSDDPFLYFGIESRVEDAATTKQTAVWMINDAAASLVVGASGGVEMVVIDTLAAGDSVLVNLETRADTVVLAAREVGGDSAGSATVPMDGQPKRIAFPR